MTLTTEVVKRIIKKLISGQDYRIEVVTLLDAQFLQYAIDFFKKVINAKLKNQNITTDWYKRELLDSNLSKTEIAINSGLNEKTIHNMFNSSTKEVVIDASSTHYDVLYESIKNLVENEKELELKLTIKLNGVSAELNIGESLIVINTIAVKRSALRGGLWSTAGKRVEKNLMITLCKLFEIPENNYAIKVKGKKTKKEEFEREIDFYLLNDKERLKCEVKLMGKGNPESADVVIARNSKIFVADKLSDTNKKQLDRLGVEWVELRSNQGLKKFQKVLETLAIPHKKFNGNIQERMNLIFTGFN